MTSHVDAETLALSAEGLLEDAEESTVQQHVAGCATCAAQRSELTELTQVLAEIPAAPLPDEVVARLDEAVRAEVESRRRSDDGDDSDDSTGPAGGTPAAGGAGSGAPADVVPFRRRIGSSHRWINYLAVAAAAVVVLGGGAAIARNLTSGGDGGATMAQPGESAETSTDKDTALGYQPLVVESGTVYTEDGLDQQAATVLDESDPMAPEGAQGDADSPAQGGGPEDTSDVPADVSSCIQALSEESGDYPIMIDLAEYSSDGAANKAWVMYYGSEPGGDAQDSYDVAVVSPDCGSAVEADQAVLARTTVPAP